MQLRNERQTGLEDELRIIPAWAWGLAVIAVVAIQFLFNIFVARENDAPPPPLRVFLGILVGVVIGVVLLFMGYVNRDSGRRGMSRALWTAIAILIPNGLGIILYFVLRQPLLSSCPQCGTAVQAGFNFCPKCNYKLNPSCPHCQKIVRPEHVFCPYCGNSIPSPLPQPTGAAHHLS